MAIKLFGGAITIGKDASELSQYAGRTDDMYGFMQQRYGTDYKVRNLLESYKGIVYDCVSLIAESTAEYEPYAERKVGDKWERIDHEFVSLINRPSGNNPDAESFSKFDLIEATTSYQLLQGDCFYYMALGKTTGRPREIVVLRPDKVGTDIDPKTGKVNGYFIRQAVGDPIPLEINEVLRFNLFSPTDPYKGYSPVQANATYIETDEATSEFTKNFFNNNAGLSGVLNVKGEVTKGAFRKFVKGWREKYEGVDNAGKIAILRDSDASFTKVGLGLDELDMAGLRKMSIADVMRAFKVPLPLLGEAEQAGLGRGNVEALEYIFAKYNIDKKMQRYDSVFQFALERYYPEDVGQVRICHENIIPADKEHELAERNLGVDRWLTRNEIRSEDEDGKDIDGGDQLFVPLNNVPINEASMADPNAAPVAPTKGITIKVVKTIKGGDDTETPAPAHEPEMVEKTSQTERFRLGLMRNQAKYERKFRKTVKPIFTAQRKEALYNLEAHASNFSKAQGQKLFNDSAYDSEITNKLQPMLSDLSKTQGGLALIFAGDTENEFQLTAPILASLERGTRKMASNFNDETLDRLNRTLAEGIQNGDNLDDLKQRVNEVYDRVDNYRSERIARTETLKASNNATTWAYKQTGYVTQKGWVVNPDACPACEEFDGKTIPLDDAFVQLGETYTVGSGEDAYDVTNDYDTIEEPPLHPNCRCTIIPVKGGDKSFKSGNVPKKDFDELAKQMAEDRVYIKSLEKHLGVDDVGSGSETSKAK